MRYLLSLSFILFSFVAYGYLTPGGGGGGGGTVTSVGLTVPSLLTVSGSPVTTSGTLAIGSSITAGSVLFGGASGFAQNNANFFWDNTNFRLGLGTASPAFPIDMVSDTSSATQVEQLTGYGVNNIGYRARHARGTVGSPTATQSGDLLSFYSGRGYGTTGFAAAATGVMNFGAGANFTDASMPTYISFSTTPTGSVTSAEAMRINTTGSLLLGTTTDDASHKLQVNGTILGTGATFSGLAASSNVFTDGSSNLTTTGTVSVGQGGTGQTTYTNGQLLIGNTTGNTLTKATLTAGTGVTVTNSTGSITLAANGVTPILTKTANYTLLSTDSRIFVNSSGGAFNITFPDPAANSGKVYSFVDVGGSLATNNVTLVRFGSEQIAGVAASWAMAANGGNYSFQSDGTNWWKVSTASNLTSQAFSGSGTFTPKGQVYNLRVCARAGAGGGGSGGGGGGGSTTTAARGGGGGSAGCSVRTQCQDVVVVPNTAYTVTIGAGGTGAAGVAGAVANPAGAAGTSAGNGNNGGNTTFSTLATWIGAPGGTGGNGGALAATGAAGAQRSIEILGTIGGSGGLANASGTVGSAQLTSRSFFAAAGNVASAGVGSGASGGGGGAGASSPGGDGTGTAGANGGAGGTAADGSSGSAGVNATAGSGAGGGGSGGGGAGGIVASTGSNGGASLAGGTGDNGNMTVYWQE